MTCSRWDIAVFTLMSRSSATSLLVLPLGDELQDLLLAVGESLRTRSSVFAGAGGCGLAR